MDVSHLEDQMDYVRKEVKFIKDTVQDLERRMYGESKLEKASYPFPSPVLSPSPYAVIPVVQRMGKDIQELKENLGLLMERLELQFVDIPAERTIVSDEETE
jgi:hypothetical protein